MKSLPDLTEINKRIKELEELEKTATTLELKNKYNKQRMSLEYCVSRLKGLA